MTPSFTFFCTDTDARLLHRADDGWTLVGSVSFDDPDLVEKIAYLRNTAARLEPSGMTTKLVIPDSQIHFAQVDVPSGFPEDAEDRVRDYLADATPYALDELAYDWRLDGDVARLAAVARETLGEAEAFASDNNLAPVAFVACPEDPALFPGEPFFDETIAARSLLGDSGKVTREDVRIELVEKSKLPAITAATIDVSSEPETVAAFATSRRETPVAPEVPPPPAPEVEAEVTPEVEETSRGNRIAVSARAVAEPPLTADQEPAPPAKRGPNRKRRDAQLVEPPAPRPTSFLAKRPDDSRPEGFRHFGYERPKDEPKIEAEDPKPKRRRKKRAQGKPVPPVVSPPETTVPAEPSAATLAKAVEDAIAPPAAEDLPVEGLTPAAAAALSAALTPEPKVTPAEPEVKAPEAPKVAAPEVQEEPVQAEEPEKPAESLVLGQDNAVPARPVMRDDILDDVPPMPVIAPVGRSGPSADVTPRGKAAPVPPPERVGASVVPLRKPVVAPQTPGHSREGAAEMTVFGARPKPKEKAAKAAGGGWFGRALVAALVVLLFGTATMFLIRTGVIGGPDEIAVAPTAPVEAVALPEPINTPSAAPAVSPTPIPPPVQILPALQVTEGSPPAPLLEPALSALSTAPETPLPVAEAARAELPGVFEQLANAAPATPVIRTEIALGSAPLYLATAPAETTAPPVPEDLSVPVPPAVIAAAVPRGDPALGLDTSRDASFDVAAATPAAPLPSRDPLDRAASGATAALIGATNAANTRAATEAFYAVTGVWPGNPAAPSLPPRPATAEVALSAINRTALPSNQVAIPAAEGLLQGSNFVPPPGAIPPITPTPEGAVSRDGVMLFAGRPAAITAPRPEPVIAEPAEPLLVVNGEAVRLITGTPPVIPPLRPGVPEAAVVAALPEGETAPETAETALANDALEVLLGTPNTPAGEDTAVPEAEIETAALPDLTPPADAQRPVARPAALVPAAVQSEPVAPEEDAPEPTLTDVDPLPAPLPGTPDTRPAARPAEIAATAVLPTPDTPTPDETQVADDLPTPLPGAPTIRPVARPGSIVAVVVPEASAPESEIALEGNGPIASRLPVARPAGLPQTAAVQTAAVVAPATVTPSIPTRASVARQATQERGIDLGRVNLIGVYGAPSDRRALVRLPSGRYVKVQVGDRVDGGQVSAIGDDDLRYVKSGRNITLELPPS